MTQKIIQVGNSYAVTIPKRFVDALGISKETVFSIQPLTKKKKIVLDFNTEDVVENIVDPEVYAVAKDLLKRYLPAFKELAQK